MDIDLPVTTALDQAVYQYSVLTVDHEGGASELVMRS
jgi:hypothetical protein